MLQNKEVVYVIDTLSFVAINELPNGKIEKAWEFMVGLIINGRIKTVPIVMDELSRVDEDAFNQVKPHDKILVTRDTTEFLLEAGRITYLYPNMCRPLSKWDLADAYVLALAKIHGYTVVSNEGRKRRKMHNVCSKEHILSLNLNEFLIQENGPIK